MAARKPVPAQLGLTAFERAELELIRRKWAAAIRHTERAARGDADRPTVAFARKLLRLLSETK